MPLVDWGLMRRCLTSRTGPPGSNGTADLGRDLSSLARVVVGLARIAQRPQLAARDGLGQTEGVAAEHVDVGEAERGEACYIAIQHGEALGSQLRERGIHINRVPQHDHVDDKPECSELILLALAVRSTRPTRRTGPAPPYLGLPFRCYPDANFYVCVRRSFFLRVGKP